MEEVKLAKGLINKPQFNSEMFKVGTAIHIRRSTTRNPFHDFDEDAIITGVTPLQLETTYYSVSSRRMDALAIPVDFVVGNEYVITFLKEEQ